MSSMIEQAIQLEVRAEANYRQGVERTNDASAAKILQLLADEEKEHARILSTLSDPGVAPPSTLLDAAKQWIRGTVEGGLPSLSPDTGLLDVLRRALDIERATETFYREQGSRSSDAATQQLFEKLAGLEHTHYAFISSLIEYYDRPSEWIENAEFGLRDEY